MKTIIHALQVGTPPDTVYRALTTEKGLSGWWTTRVSAEEGEGGTLRFTFLDDFHPQMKQDRLEPDRLVQWTCLGGHDNWIDDTFTFAFTAVEGGTRVLFKQEYAQELADDVYGTYNFNWGYYLASLKTLCETGTGAPFEPE